jgi:predicted nucleic acid-binding protein
LGLWRIHQPQVEDILSAVQIQQRHQLSFWDSMIIRSANQLGCNVIWTEDLNEDQIVEGCLIKSPFS